MHDLLLFRENDTDFRTWCSHYVRRAQSVIRTFEKDPEFYYRSDHRKEYENALKVQRQYVVLKASLSIELQYYLDNTLIEHSNSNWNSAYHNEIYENWKRICFHKSHPSIKKLDSFMLGHRLREIRIHKGLTAAKVSGILGISQKTLYCYEEGKRKISADILYRLSQIYNMGIEQIIYSTEHKIN